MRAKFIYEKFTEDSDPIQDMGIGMMHLIKKYLETESSYSNHPINKGDYFWMCVAENKIEYVKYLIEKDADVNYDNDRALKCAVYNNNFKLIKILLDAGANAKIVYKWCLDYHNISKYTKILKILKKHIDDNYYTYTYGYVKR